jgi:hypothetical protein
VAYLAYYFHWSHMQLMNMTHLERQVWVKELARINERLNDADSGRG